MENLAKRLNHDHGSIMYDEKFETWLNLNPLIKLKEAASNMDKWPLTPIYSENVQLIGYRSLQGFRDAKVTTELIGNAKITPLLPALLLRRILFKEVNMGYNDAQQVHTMIRSCVGSSLMSVNVQVQHLLSSVKDIGSKWASDNQFVWKTKLENLPREFTVAYYCYEQMLKLVNEHKRLSGMARNEPGYTSHIRVKLSSLNSSVLITPDLIIWTLGQTNILLSRSCFLEVFNKLSEMQALLLYAWLQSGTSLDVDHYVNSLRFWRHLSLQVTSRYSDNLSVNLEVENLGFSYLKSIEGLGVSELIRRGDETWDWVNERLGQTLWDALYEDRIITERSFRNSHLSQTFAPCSVETLAEIIGTVKIMGHPSIEIEAGLESLYEKTHKNLPINTDTRDACVGILTRDVIRVFYNKYKKYPNLHVDENAHPNLTQFFNRRTPMHSQEGKRLLGVLQPSDWAKIFFEKNDEFEVMDNRLALLKDKALGLTRSKVIVNWLSTQRIKRDIVDSKALLHFLFGEADVMGLQEYFNEFEKDEWTEALLDYLVIKLTAKELELKSKGRFFGASPALERDRKIVMEGNVMRFMHRLIPDQLLTPNELDIIKKLISFRDYRRLYPNCKIINISFDFSSWNNSMRKEVVDVGAGRILDPWFGTNYYNKTMKAYENMLIYYDDGIIKKKWEGQLGGIEGLNQATWSIVFIGGIKYALERLGFKYSITVKGDDVRAAIIVPNSIIDAEGYDHFRDRILSSIQLLCKDMGWSLNPNESFVSLSLIATSKQYLFNETWLPSSMKKIMKLNSHTNGIFVSLEDIIATIFSIAHSACSQTTVVMPSFVTATFIASTVLYRQLPHRLQSPQPICALLLWPQILAGPGPLPLQTFFVRGENDMLSVILSLYQFILNSPFDHVLKGYIRSILSIPLSTPPNDKMILGDPYCLDLQAPDRPESILKRQVRLILEKRVKQPTIKKLLSLQMKHQCQLMIKILRLISPYHAKVATALWEASHFYLLEELISSFTHSSTVTGFLTQMRTLNSMSRLGSRLWKRVIDASRKRWDFWESYLLPNYVDTHHLFGISLPSWLTDCPTSVANHIRCLQWGTVKGITYPSLITQNIVIPEAKMSKTLFPFGVVNVGTYSTLKIHTDTCTFETSSLSHHYASSPNAKLWLGSNTSQKVEYVDIPEATQSPVLRKLKLLIALRKSAGSLGPSILPFIEKVIKGYTRIPIQDLELLTPLNTISHFAHRVPINSFSMNTMPNSRPNISQLVSVDNETNERLKEDPVNRSINIAARQFMIIALATFPLQYMQQFPKDHPESFVSILHYDQNVTTHYEFCPHCCANVDDEVITFPPAHTLDLSSFVDQPLIACGAFETQALLQAINNIRLHNRHMNLIQHISSPDNINNVNLSLRLIIANHIQTSIETQFLIKTERIDVDFTQPDAIDNVLISEGKKPISQSLVSLNVWRSVSAKMLYENMVIEGFNLYLTHIVPHVENLSHDIISVMVPDVVHTAFSLLITRLIQVSGLSFINDGIRHTRWIEHEIPWGFHLDRVNELSYMFMKHHWHLFYTWYTQPGSCSANSSIMLYSNDTLLTQQLQSRFNYVLNAHFHAIRKSSNITWSTIITLVQQLQNEHQWLIEPTESQVSIITSLAICLLTELHLENEWSDHDHIHSLITDGNGVINLFKWTDTMSKEDTMDIIESITQDSLDMFPFHMRERICYSSIRTRFRDDDISNEMKVNYLFRLIGIQIQANYEALMERAVNALISFNSKFSLIARVTIQIGSFIECERIVKDYANTQLVSVQDTPIVSRLPSHMRVRDMTGVEPDGPLQLLCSLPHSVGGYMEALNANLIHPDYECARSLWRLSQRVQTALDNNRTRACIDGVDYMRVFGNLNKAYLRWVDVLNQTKIRWSSNLRGSCAVIIGDGGGSISRHLLNKYEDLHVIFCDKKSDSGPGSRMNSMEFPIEFISNTQINLQKRLYFRGFVTGDITKEATRAHIVTMKRQLRRSCRLIISDIVPDDLGLSNKDFNAIIYGVLETGFEVGDDGSVIMVRVPLLSQIDWGLLLVQILQGFAHVHLFVSPFDRPELMSLYIAVFKHTEIQSYTPNFLTHMRRPIAALGLNLWTFTYAQNILNWILQYKTSQLFNIRLDNSRLLSKNWEPLLNTEAVCPLNNLFLDWTKSVSIVATQFCSIWEQVRRKLQDRNTVLLGSLSNELKGQYPRDLIVRDIIIELCIIRSFQCIIEIVNDNHFLTRRDFTNLPMLGLDVLNQLHNSFPLPLDVYNYLHSSFFVNYKMPIYMSSHILRYMSWMSLQYSLIENGTDRTHPWVSADIEHHSCWSCDMIGSKLPKCTAWGIPSVYTIDTLIYPSDFPD